MRHMKPQSTMESNEEAQIMALKALGFLAADPDRFGRFLALTGLGPEAIRSAAREPSFLGGVLDHLLSDESLLLIFAEENEAPPERIVQLRRKLPGAHLDF